MRRKGGERKKHADRIDLDSQLLLVVVGRVELGDSCRRKVRYGEVT